MSASPTPGPAQGRERELVLGFEGDRKTIAVTLPQGDLPPWQLGTELRVVGTDVERVDGPAKVSGRAKYAYDVNLPGMLHGAMLRSPHPRATVKRIDVEPARAMPGVKAVLVTKPAGRRIRFAGDDVAAVAAETLDQALDALEKVIVEYDVQPFNTDWLRTDGAPKLDQDGNVVEPWPAKEQDRVDAAFAAAAATLESTYRTEVQTHSSLETHGLVARWNGDDLEVWASTQSTFGLRRALAETLRQMGMAPGSVRVHTEFMGGGFGSKLGGGAEYVVGAALAREAKAPVKLMLSRGEEHTATGNRPSALIQVRAGATKEGKLIAWDWRSWGGPGYGGGGRTTFPRHYLQAATVRSNHADLHTDTDQGRAMRAPGWPQGYFAGESMLDELAEALGIDPLDFRLQNDSQRLRQEEWKLGAERFRWRERRNPKPGQPWPGGDPRFLRGAGLSSAAWGGMGGPPAQVLCRIHRDGSVEVRSGAQDIGTGMKTVMAVLTAEELQIAVPRVRVFMGDTADPVGPGSGGSTTTPSLSPAVRLAAARAREQLCARVAEHLGVAADELICREGRIGTERRMLSFDEACKVLGADTIEARGERLPNQRDGAYQEGVCGCQFAEVEVDRETGLVRVLHMLAVQDCGVVVSKRTAESQVYGAMIGGISYALHEQRVLDHVHGRMVNKDMLFYKFTGAADMPVMEAILFPVRNGGNNVGAVGLGEPPAVAPAAAIANAVANATGARVRALPITPDKVLAALARKARAGDAGKEG